MFFNLNRSLGFLGKQWSVGRRELLASFFAILALSDREIRVHTYCSKNFQLQIDHTSRRILSSNQYIKGHNEVEDERGVAERYRTGLCRQVALYIASGIEE